MFFVKKINEMLCTAIMISNPANFRMTVIKSESNFSSRFIEFWFKEKLKFINGRWPYSV